MSKNYFVFSASVILLIMAVSAQAIQEDSLSVKLEAGIEYDDNVYVSATDQNTNQSDEAVVLDLSTAYSVVKDGSAEVELSYDFYQSLYSTLDDFDLQIHTLGASGSWIIGSVDPGIGYSYSKVRLGGDALYDSHSLTPNLGFSSGDSWYHSIGYSYIDKDFSTLSERDAVQHGVSFDSYYMFMDNSAYITVGLRYENEDTNSPEFDYHASYVKLGVSMPVSIVGEDARLAANYQHYWRDYDSVTASIGQKRDDEQDNFMLEISKPINDMYHIKLGYEYTDTDSNLPSADVSDNILRLGLSVDL